MPDSVKKDFRQLQREILEKLADILEGERMLTPFEKMALLEKIKKQEDIL